MSIRIDPKLLNQTQNSNKKRIKKRPIRVNLSWLYYIDYFKDLNFKDLKDKNNENTIKNKSSVILNYKKENLNPVRFKNTKSFVLEVDGAGLLIGSGYNHEINDIEGWLNLGLSLDYTTGYPYIPGSSIKGVVAHIIRDKNKEDYKNYLLEEFNLDENDLEELIEGVDIFFDAYSLNFEFDDDFITPHKDFKNPVPIRFLKIKRGSRFLFQFKLKNKADEKLKFIKEVLLDIGLGAKNNLNFGKFKEVRNG